MNLITRIFALALASSLCGCSTENLPLVYGQSMDVGITISGSMPEQAAELTLGFRDKNIAVVPTTRQAQVPDKTGTHLDALSVLGQFETEAEAAQPKVSLGKFFATGMAAKTLADGFKCQLGKDAPPKECRPDAAPVPAPAAAAPGDGQ